MSMLQADQDGFLVRGETLQDIRRANDLLNSIKGDISAIRRALVGGSINSRASRTSQQDSLVSGLPRQVMSIPLRDNTQAINAPQRSVNTALGALPAQPITAQPAQPLRGANGRFVSRHEDTPINAPNHRSGYSVTGQSQDATLGRFANRIASAVTESGNGIEEIDPTVKAFNEVAQPLARSYQVLFSGEKSDTKWFKKIFSILKLTRLENTTFNRAQNRSLHNIEGQQSGGEGGGGSLWMVIIPVIAAAFIYFKKEIKDFVVDLKNKINEKWEDIKTKANEYGNKLNDWFEDKTGINVKKVMTTDVVTPVVNKVKEIGNKTNDFVMDKTGINVKEKVKSGVESVTHGIDIAKGVVGGAVSKISGKAGQNKATMIAEMDAQGITDPKERAMLMAQVDHESGGFKYTKEIGRDSYFDKYDAGTRIGKSLGNTEKGDGAKFKGRGLIQLTGRANYTEASKDLGLDLVNHPELAEDPQVAAKTAMWFWKKRNLGNAAQQGDIKKVTKRINGGYNGLSDRTEKYEKYLASESTNKTAQPTVVASEQSTSIKAPSVPVMSKPIVLADATPVQAPMGSSSDRQSVSVTVEKGDVGQDVSDRGIAHISSGGLSGSM